MNNLIKGIVVFFLLIVGCASPQITIHKKDGVDFTRHKKITVLNFTCVNQGVGSEVSDAIAIKFMKHGYDVVERSQLKAIIDESTINSSGLTDSNIANLRLKGINAIVVGAVSRYDCEQSVMVVPTTLGSVAGTKNLCNVSVSIKMLNIQNSDILWAAQASHSVKGKNTTAGKVLEEVLDQIEKQIP